MVRHCLIPHTVSYQLPLAISLHSKSLVDQVLAVANRRHRMAQMTGRAGLAQKGDERPRGASDGWRALQPLPFRFCSLFPISKFRREAIGTVGTLRLPSKSCLESAMFFSHLTLWFCQSGLRSTLTINYSCDLEKAQEGLADVVTMMKKALAVLTGTDLETWYTMFQPGSLTRITQWLFIYRWPLGLVSDLF